MVRAKAAFTKKAEGLMKQNASTLPTCGKLLKREREQLGLSQQALAERVDATFVTISNWERGKTMPGPYHRRLLSDLFGKSLKELGLLPDESKESSREQIASSIQETHDTSTVSETPARIWNIPYARNLYFTGREDVLQHLHDTLLSSGTAALTQPQAISGLGGIGKTQTAVEYAYRYGDYYHTVLWVRAETRELLVSDFVDIANLLKLLEKSDEDQTRVASAVKRWLEGNSRWLLILDNVDDLEMASGFIPSASRGYTLLTTRAQATGTIAQSVEIEKMEPTVGALFLLRRAKLLPNDAPLENASVADQVEAKDIVEVMGGLPLALDQAGAYIEETACSLSGYLSLFRTRRSSLLKRRGRLVANHAEPVATTWSLSFEKVEQANPAAAELLRLCAFLHPDAIPEAMIVEGAAELGPILQPVAEDDVELNEAIGELRKYSLVKRDPELKIFNIHRLVQAVLKDQMDEATQKQWAERTMKVVNRAFPDRADLSVSSWPKCQQYLPHVRVCAELAEQWRMKSVEAARLFDQAGVYLRKHAQYPETEDFLLRARTIGEQLAEPHHAILMRSLNDLAELYHEQGKYSEAESLFQRALTIGEQLAEPHHATLTRSLNSLALLYHDQGKYSEAESLFQRALTIREQALRANHSTVMVNLSDDVASTLHNLARLYYDQGKDEQAEPLQQCALAIWEQALGPNHPQVAFSLNNLARLYHAQGKYEQAEPLHQRALAIREQALGPNHPNVAVSLNSLARLYHAQGKYEQAELLFQHALTIREQSLGREHVAVAGTLTGLAVLYRDQSNYDQAEALFQRALFIYEHSSIPGHPDVATTLENYAGLLRKMDREAEAISLEERVKTIQDKHIKEVTLQQRVPGDAVPWPGCGVSPQNPFLFPGPPQAARERYLNSYSRRNYPTGSLLMRVKQSCRERWHARAQASGAGVARQEVGAIATSRSNTA